VVIDELHLIGDQSRGYLLEVLLSKLAFLDSKHLQLIAMSATFPNLKEIAVWLGAQLYITSFRPVEVKEFIKFGSELLDKNGEVQRNIGKLEKWDKAGIFPLIEETINDKGQLLVFCSSKHQCE